jgi:hypothetical protein
VPARSVPVVFCSILILVATNGCYTVFKSQTFDGKPSVEISEQEIAESSSDYAYDTYENPRWRYYLCCPWWYQSVWYYRDDFDFGAADNGLTIDDPGEPASAPPATGRGVFSLPTVGPMSSPPAGHEIRYKQEDGNESNQDDGKSDSTRSSQPTKKPTRRGGGGR